MPEGIVNCHVRERQHTHGDGTLLIVSDGDEIARIGDHSHYLALADALVNMLNGTREYPRMEPSEALILTLPQLYLSIHHQSLLVHNRLFLPAAAAHRTA